MMSEDWPMVIAQFLGMNLLNNRDNLPREQHKEIGAWEGLKLAKGWARFSHSGKEIVYAVAGCAQA